LHAETIDLHGVDPAGDEWIKGVRMVEALFDNRRRFAVIP
jgi:hypothetical protein